MGRERAKQEGGQPRGFVSFMKDALAALCFSHSHCHCLVQPFPGSVVVPVSALQSSTRAAKPRPGDFNVSDEQAKHATKGHSL